jgi:outer membrane receptor protein involved in Fe transport
MSRRAFLFALFLLAVVGCPAASSAQGLVKGLVTDVRTRLPIAGAVVEVPEAAASTRSNAEGSFELGPLAEGSYRLHVRGEGYRELHTQVLVTAAGAPRPFDIALAPATLRSDETVNVTASRVDRETFDVPRSVSVVQAADFERQVPRTSAEALSRTPGVFVQKTNHGGGSPFVRGLVGNQVLVLVDGLRLNNSTFRYGPNQYLATVDPGQAGRIEVLRGSGSAQYGSDGLGGVIHVRNREPVLSPSGTLVTGRVGGRLMTQGQEQSARLDLGASSSRAAIAGSVAFRDFGDIVAGSGLGTESPSGYTEVDGDLRAVVDTGRAGRLTLAYQHVHQDDVPRFDQVAQRGYDRYSFVPQVRQMAFARLAVPDATAWFDSLTLTGAWIRSREGRERQRSGSSLLIVEEDTVSTWAGTLEGRRALPGGWSLVAGAEVYHDTVRSWRRDDNVDTGESTPRRGLFPDGATSLFAAGFGLGHYTRGRFAADLGARYTWTHIQA